MPPLVTRPQPGPDPAMTLALDAAAKSSMEAAAASHSKAPGIPGLPVALVSFAFGVSLEKKQIRNLYLNKFKNLVFYFVNSITDTSHYPPPTLCSTPPNACLPYTPLLSVSMDYEY